MITPLDLFALALLAHVAGAVASPLYVEACATLASFARRIRRPAVPRARAVPSYWIDQLAHLNPPTVTRRRSRVIDV